MKASGYRWYLWLVYMSIIGSVLQIPTVHWGEYHHILNMLVQGALAGAEAGVETESEVVRDVSKRRYKGFMRGMGLCILQYTSA